MNHQKAQVLIEKYKANTLTAKEHAILEAWYNDMAGSKESDYDYGLLDSDLAEIWGNIRDNVKPDKREKVKRFKFYAAAAAILLISLGLIFYKLSSKKNNAELSTKVIVPGGNKAQLILADGRRLILSDIKQGEIAAEANMKITKTADGQLVYTPITNGLEKGQTATGFNQIETPRGGQYQINLPDGSRVWLNASSSLKYPVQFSGAERRVELSGEAYFEVAHDIKKPFRVKTADQEVEVLGTHFNISAYRDDALTKTTLLQGSVKVIKDKSDTGWKILKPNEQAINNRNRTEISIVSAIDAEDEVSWKSGYFTFQQDDVEKIMSKLARWYDFEVVYRGKPSVSFIGSISRYDDIKKVLHKLELTNQVHFKIEERRIIVMP